MSVKSYNKNSQRARYAAEALSTDQPRVRVTDAQIEAARKVLWGPQHAHLNGDDLLRAALEAASLSRPSPERHEAIETELPDLLDLVADHRSRALAAESKVERLEKALAETRAWIDSQSWTHNFANDDIDEVIARALSQVVPP